MAAESLFNDGEAYERADGPLEPCGWRAVSQLAGRAKEPSLDGCWLWLRAGSKSACRAAEPNTSSGRTSKRRPLIATRDRHRNCRAMHSETQSCRD
jgi:hypothetical protein